MRFPFRKSSVNTDAGQPGNELSTESQAFFSIYLTARLLRQNIIRNGRGQNLEMLPEQFFLMERLRVRPGQSQADLSHGSFEDRPSISRTLTTLERRSWIYKRVDANDTRRYKVYLSKAGLEACGRFEPILKEAISTGFKGLSARERQEMQRLLDFIQSNLLETSELD